MAVNEPEDLSDNQDSDTDEYGERAPVPWVLADSLMSSHMYSLSDENIIDFMPFL